MPPTIPTVAMPSARSAPSAKPTASKVSPSPPAVPWPPSKPISISAPAKGSMPNSGVSTSIVSKIPTAYWPAPMVTPSDSCGPPRCQIVRGPGIRWPRNSVANTTLINSPGSSSHTDRIDSPNSPPASTASSPATAPTTAPSTCGPNSRARKPARIEAGKKSRCGTPQRVRTSLATSSRTPSRWSTAGSPRCGPPWQRRNPPDRGGGAGPADVGGGPLRRP